jgi:tRNA threonylcarbamoyl adenosine modification protein YeaZ
MFVYKDEKIILVIETTQKKGSVSLFIDGVLSESIVEDEKKSKSKNFLELIDKVLTGSGVDKQQINSIVVSGGPGSITGIRTGISLAKGLSDALCIDYFVVDIFEVLWCDETVTSENELVAFSLGKNSCVYCIFDKLNKFSEKKDFEFCKEVEFNQILKNFINNYSGKILISDDLFKIYRDEIKRSKKDFEVVENFATLIGKKFISQKLI